MFVSAGMNNLFGFKVYLGIQQMHDSNVLCMKWKVGL